MNVLKTVGMVILVYLALVGALTIFLFVNCLVVLNASAK